MSSCTFYCDARASVASVLIVVAKADRPSRYSAATNVSQPEEFPMGPRHLELLGILINRLTNTVHARNFLAAPTHKGDAHASQNRIRNFFPSLSVTFDRNTTGSRSVH